MHNGIESVRSLLEAYDVDIDARAFSRRQRPMGRTSVSICKQEYGLKLLSMRISPCSSKQKDKWG